MSDYYKEKESVEEYIHLAKDVNGTQLIEKLKMHLNQGSKLLELGSGPGTDWALLSEYYDVTGSDYSDEFLNHLVNKYPGKDFLKLDAETLTIDDKFDGIYSNKVLQHLSDAELNSSIINQSKILNDKSIICHSFWKGDGSELFKGMCVNYHQEADLRSLFEEYFEIILIDSYKEFEEYDSLLLIAKKVSQ
jgi:cyclopropane fatty-acyl-phospholipid synthase-like methyltransferase